MKENKACEKRNPTRMCVICRQRFEKNKLKRYVLVLNGKLEEDEKACQPGRGYYCCSSDSCRKNFAFWNPAKRIRKRSGVIGR